MKGFRLFVFFLLALVVSVFLFSFFISTSRKVTRSIQVDTSAAYVYSKIARLSNFSKIAVWGKSDSTLAYQHPANDSVVNAESNWKGSPALSGEGQIKILAAEIGKKMTHQISFSTPQKGKATSELTFMEKEKNKTEVTWTFSKHISRPWNIFNLFSDDDKDWGPSFEEGLKELKKMCDQ